VVEPTGAETMVRAEIGGETFCAVFRERHAFAPGDRLDLCPEPGKLHLFDAESGRRLN
jgi:multiple sugar transport system ATP-binding protein